jgi:hypothetical protein
MGRQARYWQENPNTHHLPVREDHQPHLRLADSLAQAKAKPRRRTCPELPFDLDHLELLAALRDCVFDTKPSFSQRMARLFALHAGVRHASIASNGLAPCPTCGAWGPHTARSGRALDERDTQPSRKKRKQAQPLWACTACGCKWQECVDD